MNMCKNNRSMDNTLYTLEGQEPTTLSARAARSINWSRKFSNGVLVLVIGLACLGPRELTPTKTDIEQQDGQPTVGHRDDTTETPTRLKKVMEGGKIVLMGAMNAFAWCNILSLMFSVKNFFWKLSESIRFGSFIGMPIGAILGTIWGVAARWGKAKEKLGWGNLIWPVTIFFGIVVAALYSACQLPKGSRQQSILVWGLMGLLLLGGPFVMPCIIYTMRPLAKPAIQARPPSQVNVIKIRKVLTHFT